MTTNHSIEILSLLFALTLIIPATTAISPPGDWWGKVIIDGRDTSKGATIQAYINNNIVAETTVGKIKDEYYLIHVPGKAGDTIIFKIESIEAQENPIEWSVGDHDRLDLHATPKDNTDSGNQNTNTGSNTGTTTTNNNDNNNNQKDTEPTDIEQKQETNSIDEINNHQDNNIEPKSNNTDEDKQSQEKKDETGESPTGLISLIYNPQTAIAAFILVLATIIIRKN